VLLYLNHQSGVPVYRQIHQQLRERIASGQLAANSQLPSVRELSADLKINPLTVAKVYQMLERDGLVEFRRGLGTFVSGKTRIHSATERKELIRPAIEQLVREARYLGLTEEKLRQLIHNAYENNEP
jgi:GntR family transcriptional regulator